MLSAAVQGWTTTEPRALTEDRASCPYAPTRSRARRAPGWCRSRRRSSPRARGLRHLRAPSCRGKKSSERWEKHKTFSFQRIIAILHGPKIRWEPFFSWVKLETLEKNVTPEIRAVGPKMFEKTFFVSETAFHQHTQQLTIDTNIH